MGETSEGRHLYHYAKEYAQRSGDCEYLGAIQLFIAEEQRHARNLARFLKLNQIPTLETTFLDRIFRRLRHMFGGLEISIAVLITGEIIAKVYYAVLKEASNSIVLRTLCDRILGDEEQHVEFQAQQLGKLRAHRGRLLGWLTMTMQRCLYWGTCILVWEFHKQAIRKGGLNFARFWQECWDEFDR